MGSFFERISYKFIKLTGFIKFQTLSDGLKTFDDIDGNILAIRGTHIPFNH